MGFNFSFDTKLIQWCNKSIPFSRRNSKPSHNEYCPDLIENYIEEQLLVESDYDTLTTGSAIAAKQEHLSEENRTLLSDVLDNFNDMFNRTLGFYDKEIADLELANPNTIPIHCRPFPVPDKFRDLFKKELDKLVNLGVLRPVKTSAWAFPTFLAVPKKDGTARFLSDFRKLNAVLKSVQYPMPPN